MRLAKQTDRRLLSDMAVLATSRITQMPPDGEERIVLLERSQDGSRYWRAGSSAVPSASAMRW